MTDHQVSFIKQSQEQKVSASRIQFIGGMNRDGTYWKTTVREAVAGIELGKWRFWLDDGHDKSWLIIDEDIQGNKYLKAEHDAQQSNGLLALPDMPIEYSEMW